MSNSAKVFVAGHLGMVGSAILRTLQRAGYTNIVTRRRNELDLTNQTQVRAFFQSEQIEQIYMAAAKVGGILANSTYPAEFIYQNLMVELNIIHEAWNSGVRRLLFLGSSCIYPREASQPISESALLTGQLEPTNEAYAIAKIAGIKMCQSYNREHGTDYRCIMPTNLYGPGDNYDPSNSHVIPGLIRRFHEAKMSQASAVEIWGTGKPHREFMFVDDLAAACVLTMELPDADYARAVQPNLHINAGTGEDITILELAELIRDVVGFHGSITFDQTKPDGMPRKLLDVTRIRSLGWQPRVSLRDGLQRSYADFLSRNVLP
ncbi:GDP-L-fucose synthase [Bradyrhizobium sp. USDA 4532]|uniref:GDP-L-fucose synthase family protein n=1 Tax=unclassified Bradyrhizobium TaxID=2631580 RepID=UPI0020A09ABE|nr:MULTISPECIES: GDP-L-fucose synthase [unclassified Bradyrhizobium]MCP1831725.1 GDP-L-fucose synthase [Bradyrhizobium sp. USDA 4545]MCP1916561.1 GDP-L-fucose synthase [Bradyrhizobium sp. USDA 4532]